MNGRVAFGLVFDEFDGRSGRWLMVFIYYTWKPQV